jgi:hypothetical protein
MRTLYVPLFLSLSLVSCGDQASTDPVDVCQTVALPLAGSQGGPTVTDVALDPQVGEGVVVLATATDPDGTDNMLTVLQTIGVFPDAVCEGPPIVLQDDLACSGCEESFGIAVSPANQSLFAEIAASVTWPVMVEFSDLDGHQTTGRVRARVVR